MKKQTFYESEDGQIFDNEEDCQLWEIVSPRLKKLGTARLNFQHLFDDDTNIQCPEWIKSISLDNNFLTIELEYNFSYKESREDGKKIIQECKNLKNMYEYLWGINEELDKSLDDMEFTPELDQKEIKNIPEKNWAKKWKEEDWDF